MVRLNVPRQSIYTHEGAKAQHINSEQQLRRSVMASMLWEKTFYEDGQTIVNRIKTLIPKVSPEKVIVIAKEARDRMYLRHIPLLITREMARINEHKKYVADTLENVIQRPDELTEFLAIYWKDGKEPLSAQVKKGLARAFTKFNEYQLAKYNRDGQIKLRDVLFLCHAKPKDKEQEFLWKRLIDNQLAIPDTWEVALSANDGKSKKEKWERLLVENRLGALALLRNLRNFKQENVNNNLILNALDKIKTTKVLPFRFISAAKHNPWWEEHIEKGMMKCLSVQEKIEGKTIFLIDVSGSMFYDNISAKSDLLRADAACALAILAREVFSEVDIYTFSNNLVQVPARHGFALRDAILKSQYPGGTYLGNALRGLRLNKNDRLIVLTDEQSHDTIPFLNSKNYLINVASYQNGIGYGSWIHIDGWSEAIIDYIREYERIKT